MHNLSGQGSDQNKVTRFWWVNHKQTVKQEIADGYLWSPQTESGGKRSQFYDNMRVAAPGDRVVSYANRLIKYVGVVQDFARLAPRPPGFHELGKHWGEIGWLLPVEWKVLPQPVHPRELVEQLGPLLPKKYSPFNPVTGDGNQKAYFAEISSETFELLIPVIEAPPIPNPVHGMDALVRVDDALQDSIATDQSLDATTKQQLILARHGQGSFRSRVIGRYKKCVLTGVESPELLVASHIKPWRACSDSGERLSAENGLLLTPNADRLFDRGLLTFADDGAAKVSLALSPAELEKLGLAQACSDVVASFSEATREFLAFHRRNVFLVP
ncbi:HNH endonuclease [Lysobacter capsici]|uniref:HNH endonuclease n=1 Tax=Lysobacter capsici TaxID=435897 RepID=UPI001C003633|nr:HNH endonuclease [Lysobacter capsici]QWF19109.1 HNH endonuclease [Lysobacter capsici]